MFEMLDNLHFLRPWWFLALLPIVFIIWRAWQVNRKQGAWHEVIEPKFRTLLLGENASAEPSVNEKVGYIGLAVAWVTVIIALSGPWVKSVEVPAQKSQQGVVVVLDLSLSMLADDITPNRLARVKYRLTDLLKQYPEYATGMVAYAGSAHTISPISEDNQTLLSLLPSLNPVMMPRYGSNPLLGFKLADNLLKGAQITQGHLIWITDDIEESEVTTISNWISAQSYSVTVLSVGTEKGGVVQIPNHGLLKDSEDTLIMPSLPSSRFNQLSRKANIKWVRLKTEVDDVKALLPPEISAAVKQANELEKEVNHPLDIGPYFLFLFIPLVAFIFRKGTLLSLSLLVLIPIGVMSPQASYASEFIDAFKSPNQQAYEAWQKENYETAEALFENPQWRASAFYRQGKYEEAAKIFELDKSPSGLYNLANALTMAGSYEKAHAIYEKVLQLKPDFKEAADNLAIVKNILSQKPPQTDKANKTNNSDQSQNNQNQDEQSQQQQQASSEQQPSQGTNGQNTSNQDGKAGQGEQSGASSNNGTGQNKTSSGSMNSGQNNQNSNQTDTGQSSTELDQESNAANGTGKGNPQQEVSESEQAGADNGQAADENARPTKLDDGSQNQQSGTSYINNSDDSPLTEDEQAKQNWLQQIPDQPGLFLKRKFEYQYQTNQNSDETPGKQW